MPPWHTVTDVRVATAGKVKLCRRGTMVLRRSRNNGNRWQENRFPQGFLGSIPSGGGVRRSRATTTLGTKNAKHCCGPSGDVSLYFFVIRSYREDNKLRRGASCSASLAGPDSWVTFMKKSGKSNMRSVTSSKKRKSSTKKPKRKSSSGDYWINPSTGRKEKIPSLFRT